MHFVNPPKLDMDRKNSLSFSLNAKQYYFFFLNYRILCALAEQLCVQLGQHPTLTILDQ